MIWMFEGGPWDGQALEIQEDVSAPPHQVVTPLGGSETHYWLADVREPLTFVYRAVISPRSSDAPG